MEGGGGEEEGVVLIDWLGWLEGLAHLMFINRC